MLKTNYKLLHTCTCKEVVAFLCHGCPGVHSPLQASEEYLKQARNMEKRWTKELQNERDLRQQLQENLETMANQIHGLENEAKWTAEGRPRISSQGSKENLPPSGASSEISSSSSPNRIGGFEGEEGNKRVGEGEKRKGEGEESEEDEKFFDAQEVSVDEWAKSTKAEFLGGQPDPTALEGVGGPAAADLPPFDVKKTEVVCQ